MKVYSNSEVMMLLEENPKLRFESEFYGDSFEMYVDSLETEEGTLNYIRVDSDGCVNGMDGNILINSKWTLKQQPVTWGEVMESDKNCRVEHELLNEKSFANNDEFDIRKFGSIDVVMWFLSKDLSAQELRVVIKEGKWYLEN